MLLRACHPLLVGLAIVLLGEVTMAADKIDPGRVIYEMSCISCHGPEGEGTMPGVPDLTKENVFKKPVAELVRNTIQGLQSPGSPLAMPPKGGNPKLTQQDVVNVIRYMRETFSP